MVRSGANAAVSVERFFEFSILGLVASGFLALAGSDRLDITTVVLTVTTLALRAAGIFPLNIPRRAANLATLAYIAFFPVDYYLLSRDLLAAVIHLLFFLTVAKLLTGRTGRDYAYTAVIAFLQLLVAAVLSSNLNFFVFLALYAVLSPGMEGAAKVQVGRDKVLWVVSRKMVNWLRLHLWW